MRLVDIFIDFSIFVAFVLCVAVCTQYASLESINCIDPKNVSPAFALNKMNGYFPENANYSILATTIAL